MLMLIRTYKKPRSMQNNKSRFKQKQYEVIWKVFTLDYLGLLTMNIYNKQCINLIIALIIAIVLIY